MALDLRSSELEFTFIKERICSIEKHFSEISLKLAKYIKKVADVRDGGDSLAKCILHFASKENLNLSLRNALSQFADILMALQEYRDAQIQRIDVKVVLEFDNYNRICKKTKEELKTSFEIQSKELNKKNLLEKTRSKNPSNWQKIAQAERAVNEAKNEATRTTVEFSRKIDNFERQKIDDIKDAFLEFIKIEMLFHAKAIELYSKAYNTIKAVNVEADLMEFRSHFRSYSTPLDYDSLCPTDENNKSAILASKQIPNHELKINSQSKNLDNTTNISNPNLNLEVIKKTNDHSQITSNTNVKLLLQKAPESPKSIQSNKTNHSGMENSCASFDSFNESKFEFGHYCL